MTLCDTGPLVAIIDADDINHDRCVEALRLLPPTTLLTTWPCLTEAMHLLGRAGGFPAQDQLWGFIADGLLRIHLPEASEWQRIRALMQKYADVPMDFGDASLVAMAEGIGSRAVFTLDNHFRLYRIHGSDHFEVVP